MKITLTSFIVSFFLFNLWVFERQCVGDTTSISYQYDQAGRLIKVTYGNHMGLYFGYDIAGNRIIETTTPPKPPSNHPPETIRHLLSDEQLKYMDSANVQLSWEVIDPDATDVLIYKLYFGSAADELYLTDIVLDSFTTLPLPLDAFRTYYWKIVAHDNHGAVKEGPVWQFQTKNAPPKAILGPVPNHQQHVSPELAVWLQWTQAQDPNPIDTVLYDVYIGDSATPPLYQAGLKTNRVRWDQYQKGKTYYWKVIAQDQHGAKTESPLWSFTLTDEPVLVKTNHLNTNTHLPRKNGPYLIDSEVTTEPNSNLSIEPGTTIVFKGAYSQLVIKGTILAQGTADEPIIFTASGDTSTTADWQGIILGGAGESRLEHCIIEFGGSFYKPCLMINNASPVIKHSIIRHCFSDAIRIKDGAPIIEDSVIHDNGENGISAHSSQPTLRSNVIEKNGNYALYLKESVGYVTDNSISGGFYIESSTLPQFSNNLISYTHEKPSRLPADYVGDLWQDNTITDLKPGCELNVEGGRIIRDAIWFPNLIYHILNRVTIFGTDGSDHKTTLRLEPGVELRFDGFASHAV